jgi:hypothetical protein
LVCLFFPRKKWKKRIMGTDQHFRFFCPKPSCCFF